MPTIRQVGQLIQQGSYNFLLILRMLSYTFLLLSINITFYICLATQILSDEGFAIGLATAPRVFTSLTKSIMFLCYHKGFHVIIYLDGILVLTNSKHASKRAKTFLSLLVCLGVHINFSMSELHLVQHFLGMFWDSGHVWLFTI